MRLSVVVAAVCLCVVGLSVADETHASIKKTDENRSAGSGIRAASPGEGSQLSDHLRLRRGQRRAYRGAVGEFTSEEALKVLLNGTGLTYRYLDDRTVTVYKIGSNTARLKSANDAMALSVAGGPPIAEPAATDSATSSAGVQPSRGAARGALADAGVLGEVVVTARHREESSQNVPIALTALTGAMLESRGVQNIADAAQFAPNVSFDPGTGRGGGATAASVFIRGIGSE